MPPAGEGFIPVQFLSEDSFLYRTGHWIPSVNSACGGEIEPLRALILGMCHRIARVNFSLRRKRSCSYGDAPELHPQQAFPVQSLEISTSQTQPGKVSRFFLKKS
ncbi:MAG: hypothetical protein IJ037_14020 [Clostridia bacterium]|nr:hypothetical protein [Clostridia bacterium]